MAFGINGLNFANHSKFQVSAIIFVTPRFESGYPGAELNADLCGSGSAKLLFIQTLDRYQIRKPQILLKSWIRK